MCFEVYLTEIEKRSGYWSEVVGEANLLPQSCEGFNSTVGGVSVKELTEKSSTELGFEISELEMCQVLNAGQIMLEFHFTRAPL
jgi:hypothetical protein